MGFNKIVRIPVGTDSSRPLGLSIPKQGRDESVPTIHLHLNECRRDHVYGVHGQFIAYTFSTHHGETRLSRNELRGGRHKCGPYDTACMIPIANAKIG